MAKMTLTEVENEHENEHENECKPSCTLYIMLF